MQRILSIIFLFVVLVNKTKGQNYHPWPQSNAIWVTSVVNQQSSECWHYFIPPTDYDTTITGINYSKIYHGNFNYQGAIRSDFEGKVFFIPKDFEVEYLLYDFSAEIGDTIVSYPERQVIVYSVDSIVINDEPYKRLGIKCIGCAEQDYWIDGIGGSAGLFETQGDIGLGFSYFLNCMSHNGHSFYPEYKVGESCDPKNCYIIGFGNKEAISVKIFPCPFESRLFIEGLTGQEEIRVFDFKGQCLLDRKAEFNSNLDLDHLPRGIYFLQINLGHINLVNRKVFKVN
jgi:hypothetical protein